MTTVVVPLDGSDVAERAIPHARFIAERLQADTVLLSVVEAPTEFTVWAAAPVVTDSQTVRYWLDAREEYLAQIAASRFAGLKVRTQTTIGPPAPAIVELVKDPDDTMIVMTSHGRTGFRRLVVGSVASRVVRISPCPVLVVPAHDEEVIAPGMDRILVPLDGSEFALRALYEAARLLGLSGMHVHLVQVIDVPTITTPGLDAAQTTQVDYNVLIQYTAAARQEAERYLDGIREGLTSRGIQADWEVREGDAADEIRIAAQHIDAQLIAMATHGRSGLDRAIIGSVAEKLISEIHRPILLVGPEGR